MRKFVLSLILIVIILGGIFCQKPEEKLAFSPVTAFDPNRDAAKDLELAVFEAQRTGRYILLDIDA